MSADILKRLKALKIGNYVYGIFVAISLLGFYANKKEKDYIFEIDENGAKKAHTARMIILIVAILVYIYFLENRISNRTEAETKTQKFLNNLDVLAAILFVIGAAISLYLEYRGDESAIITE